MKYWFFNGNDVLGPFTPKELAADKSFSATSLVCPENFSDDGDHWQLASTFEELTNWLAPDVAPDEDTITLDEELDTLLHEKSLLAFEGPSTDGPGLQLPKKPAKPGPIEDYFNHIEKEDLGDILGIPDPNENSDMDLAHALEKQLAKTSSTRRREREELAAYTTDEETAQALQTSKELPQAEQTHHVATATEVFATKAPVTTVEKPAAAPATMPTVDFPKMPTVGPVTSAADITQPQTKSLAASSEPEELTTTHKITKNTPQSAPAQPQAVASDSTPKTQPETNAIIPDPAQLRHENIEVNSINARLKQTQEMKDFLNKTQQKRLKTASTWEQKIWMPLLILGIVVGGIVLAYTWQQPDAEATPNLPQPTVAQELLSTTQVKPLQVPPVAVKPAPTQEQKALSIVQNYPLSGNRGTLANYLTHIYQSQLAQGYVGAWEAEALHKNTYLVKYRLTKTRKEPIIYIFQADVAQGKLTGALNNISLDLVGKI